MAAPTRPNERWPAGFMSDQLASGQRLRIPAVAAGFSGPRVGQLVATSITGARLALFLDELGKAVVCDNGPELTSKAMRFWSERFGAALNFIQPGKPTMSAFVESFNGKFRDSCLNQHWFRGLADVRRIVDDWRHHYNHERSHSSLGYSTPAERAKQAVPFHSLSNWTCFRGRVSGDATGPACAGGPPATRRRAPGPDGSGPSSGGAPAGGRSAARWPGGASGGRPAAFLLAAGVTTFLTFR